MTIQTATGTKIDAYPFPAGVKGTAADAMPVTINGIASRVVLDRKRGTATKVYRKHFLVRLLYWLAFQASFPYICNKAALMAAQYRRRIASLITKFFLGRDLVAPVIEVRPEGNGYAFVTELVRGESPRDRKHARKFLGRVTDAFLQAGLPTWQVTPNNPRAVGNLIETEDGDYRIIDLESNVVTPMMPLSGLWGAAREGHLPAFDDIDVPRLRAFVSDNRSALATTLGAKDFRALQKAIESYDRYEREWHENEPRVWGRIARFVARVVDMPAHIRGLRRVLGKWGNSGKVAESWLRDGIARWREEGRLTESVAIEVERSLEAPATLSVISNLGAHIAMSVPLRFPFGSAARFLWTLGFRAKAEVRALLRRRVDDDTRTARRVHTLAVAFVAAVPGVGAVAYVLAEPLRKNRVLLAVAVDLALRKLPFRIYGRLHLGTLTSRLAASCRKQPRSARDWGWLKPSRLVSAAQSGIASLKPYRGMIAGVLAFNALAVIAGGVYLAVTGSRGAFVEMGPITTLKVAESLAAGALGVLVYRRFWSRSGAEARPGAAGSFFWLVAGLGLGWLAVDDYLQIHERVGAALLGSSVPLLNHSDDAIVLGYGIVAISVIAVFFREIMSSRPVVTLLVAGMSFGLLMMAVDFFVPERLFVAGLEDPAHVAAVGSVLVAFAVKYRQVDAQSRPAEGRIMAGSRVAGPAPAAAYAASQQRQNAIAACD
ncbi:MAG: hypothetical protein V3S20_02760 [Dehalococcoidia bacterium]